MHKMITKRGPIFVAGNYPDKKFAMTKEEVAETVRLFKSPVPLDLNHHKRTLKRLDDRLGRLTEISHDGKGTMFGVIEIPEWLNEVACKDDDGKDLPLPVSCGFGKDKSIVKLALTDTPRVSEAAVFAAFSEAHPDEAAELSQEVTEVGGGEVNSEIEAATASIVNSGSSFGPEYMATFAAEFAKKVRTNEGQSVLQSVHDNLARAGAICSAAEAEFHSEEELSAVQAAHDAVVAGGAACRILREGERPSSLCCFNSELSGTADDKTTKETNMNSKKIELATRLMAFINGDSTADGAEFSTEAAGGEAPAGAPAAAAIAAAPAKTTDFSAELEAEKAARLVVENQLKELRASNIKTQASAFATEVISGKHAQESDRASIEAAFSQAQADDDANPVEIQFSADTKGTRVDQLRNLYGSKKVTPLTEEALNESETEVLLSDDSPKPNADRLAAVKERAKELAARETKRLDRIAARK